MSHVIFMQSHELICGKVGSAEKLKDELLSIQLLENGAPWWGKCDVIRANDSEHDPPSLLPQD